MAIKKIDFNTETFEVGKSYLLQDIREIENINKGLCDVNIYSNELKANDNNKGLRKKAIHINFKSEDVDLWFIQDSYSSYKCVMFEN